MRTQNKKDGHKSNICSHIIGKGETETAEAEWLFKAFLPLAKKIAARFLWSGYPIKELYSVAAGGLGEAIENFDGQKFDNGLAAYATPWILGALKSFITKGRSIVSGDRRERGKYLPRRSRIDYFGNVQIGDGTTRSDLFDQDIGGDGDNFDDDDFSGFLLESFADHRLGAMRGHNFRPRRFIGTDLRIKWDGENWKWIGNAWLDHDAKLFLHEYREYCRWGIGYLYRDRRTENKFRCEIPPHEPRTNDSNRLIRLADRETWILASELNKHVKLGPAPYCWDHRNRLLGYQRLDAPAFVSNKERNASQPNWERPTPKLPWKVELCVKLKAEHASMFWSDDNLSEYELWSVPTYSRALYERYFRPHRAPWLTANHQVLDKHGKRSGFTEHSPFLMGESDYGHKDVGFCLENWTALGQVSKLTGEQVGKDIVFYKPRKGDIRQYLKPDSKLVLLFWARHIIMMHYIRYWMPEESQAAA